MTVEHYVVALKMSFIPLIMSCNQKIFIQYFLADLKIYIYCLKSFEYLETDIIIRALKPKEIIVLEA